MTLLEVEARDPGSDKFLPATLTKVAVGEDGGSFEVRWTPGVTQSSGSLVAVLPSEDIILANFHGGTGAAAY